MSIRSGSYLAIRMRLSQPVRASAMSCLILIFCLSVTLLLAVQEQNRNITPQDIVSVREVADPELSPDGKWVAFVVREPSGRNRPEEALNSDIWMVAFDGNSSPRKYAFGPKQESMPRWSPDGRDLAFLSNRAEGGKNQIYLMSTLGGEAEAITMVPEAVEAFQWHPDSKRIAFTTRDLLGSEEKKRHAEGDDEQVVDEKFQHIRLHMIDLNSREVKAISLETEDVNDFDFSPDGFRIDMAVSPTPEIDDIFFRSSLVVINFDGSGRMELNEKSYGNVRWSPDGSRILHLSPVGRGIAYFPQVITLSGRTVERLAENYHGVVWEMDWLPDGRIVVSSQEGAQGILAVMQVNPFRVLTLKRVGRPYTFLRTFSLSANGKRIAFLDADPDSAPDVWCMETDGSRLKQISDANPQLASLTFVATEIIEWKSKDENPVEGILVKPVGYVQGKRYPLVVQIHGGPDWSWWNGWHASWHEWAQLLASNGYAVLLPNPRGSQAYGQRFLEGNVNDWGGRDFVDIMAGVDHLISMGIADAQRLGIGGWSYGGFMTAWAITQTPRFRAAVMGAGLSNLTSQYGTHDIPTYMRMYFESSPYEGRVLYEQRSPIHFMQNVRTPTLIVHGAEDKRVPRSQAQEFYQALRSREVTTRLVLYPREPHEINEQAHRLDLLQRVLGWFDQYLKEQS